MASTVDQVYRDYNTPGVPSSGDFKPKKAEIRALLKQIQNGGGLAVTRNSFAALSGVTPPTENYMGVVLNDPDPTKNGYYSRVSAAWVWERGFPDTFASLSLSGTANSQAGALAAGANPSVAVVFFATVMTPNTGPMTLQVAGGEALPVVNAAGNALSSGEWDGTVLFFLNSNDEYQLLFDAGAVAAAAASATLADERADDAEAAATIALGVMTTVIDPQFSNLSTAQAFSPVGAPDYIRTAGYTAAGDGGGALFKKVGSEPSHAGKFSITLQNASVVWYEIAESVLDPMMLGADGTGATDASTAILATSSVAATLKAGMRWTKRHRMTSNATIARRVTFEQGGSLVLPASVRIGFAGGIEAGDYKIFEYTDRSSRVYIKNVEVRGYWWGASSEHDGTPGGFLVKNNDVYLQYACDSVAGYGFNNDAAYQYTWDGGAIVLPAGYFLMQGGVTMHSFTTIRGAGRGTIFTPDTAGWTGVDNFLFYMYREITKPAAMTIASPCVVTSAGHGFSAGTQIKFSTTGALPTGLTAGTTYFVLATGLTTDTFRVSTTDGGSAVNTSGSQSGTHTIGLPVSQFNVRLENCRIWGQGFSGVVFQVKVESGQEQCGCYNVHFDNIYRFGLYYWKGYGGAAIFEVRQCEFWLAQTPHIAPAGVYVDATGYTVSWLNFIVQDCTFAGWGVTITTEEWAGIQAFGRTMIEAGGIHGEHLQYMVLLDGAASIVGGTISAGPSIGDVIAVDNRSGSPGIVDVNARIGGAVRLYRDFDNAGNNVSTDVTYTRLQK